MIVNGIIAEYNPFHNGHAKHIQEMKKDTGADYTVVALSSNFVQRGAPALLDKFTRARMALENGADLVLELPAIYSVSSAEFFAMGGVSLLDKLGCINYLCFGTEARDLSTIEKLAGILSEEPEEYSEYLRRYLRDGMSFPLARNSALLQYDSSLCDVANVLNSPNNILGIEYIKAINRRKSSIAPKSLLREGSGYHDRMISNSSITSAQAIREAIFRKSDVSLEKVMPENVYQILQEKLEKNEFLDSEDFSAMLYYKLLQEREIGYTDYLDVNKELSDKIVKKLPQYHSLRQFCDLLKSKEQTYSRVARSLMHILLDIKISDVNNARMLDYVPYARILGFKKESEALLTQINVSTKIPLISKLPSAKDKLYAESYSMLRKEKKINDIYTAALSLKSNSAIPGECSTPIVII